ncbi:unnamed protein product [Ixodes persulcatus]
MRVRQAGSLPMSHVRTLRPSQRRVTHRKQVDDDLFSSVPHRCRHPRTSTRVTATSVKLRFEFTLKPGSRPKCVAIRLLGSAWVAAKPGGGQVEPRRIAGSRRLWTAGGRGLVRRSVPLGGSAPGVQDLRDELGNLCGVSGLSLQEGHLEEFWVVGPFRGLLLQAVCADEIFVLRRELAGWQPRRVVFNDVFQLLKGIPEARVGELPYGQLNLEDKKEMPAHHRDAQAPDVGLDVVAEVRTFRVDSLRLRALSINIVRGPHRHVRLAAGVHGLGYGFDQVARDAKVAHLDVSLPVDEDVGRLHVAVDHVQLALETKKVTPGTAHREGNLAQDALRDGLALGKDLLVELVQGRVHDLHADPDIPFPEQRPVELHRVGVVARAHRHVQIHEQALLLLGALREDDRGSGKNVGVTRPGPPHLYGHYGASWPVPHLLHDAVGSPAKQLDHLQVFGGHVNLTALHHQLCPRVQVAGRSAASPDK